VYKLLPALLLFLLPLASLAQDVGWVSDKQFVPLRSGQGSEFRIVHRGLPSGTRLTITGENKESGYTQVTTAGGSSGWIRSQYLMRTQPAAIALQQAQASNAKLQSDVAALQSRFGELEQDYDSATGQLNDRAQKLDSTSNELTELKRISGNALTLDSRNRSLVEESEVLKSRIEVLQADNLRLQSSIDSEAFMNGAFAVILGVFITLLVPRLWPKRRTSSSWA
jgi:SH3 domain protein